VFFVIFGTCDTENNKKHLKLPPTCAVIFDSLYISGFSRYNHNTIEKALWHTCEQNFASGGENEAS
jgi:hypothetical protein